MPSLFIDGQWVASADGATSPVVNPSDGTVVTEVDVATDDQVQAAIAAARRAFDATDWPRTPTGDRAALLDRVAGLIDRDHEEMARLETLNTGKAMRESRWDMSDVARVFRYYADLADKEAGRLVDTNDPNTLSRIVYEPVGVCALIGPWNYPLLQMSWKIAPALAAGNTAVMKPAHYTPLSTIHLTRLLEEAGVPQRRRQPRPRSRRPGRPGAGRQPGRRPHLADRRARGRSGAAAWGGRQRQAGRPRARRQEPEHRVRRRRLRDGRRQRPDRGVRPLRPGLLRRLPGDRPGRDLRPVRRGDRRSGRTGSGWAIGTDEATEAGALISADHREKVEGYVASAIAEGARLVAGGRRPDEPELQDGFFYRPTVFADVHRDMRIIREEVFGPVLTVERFTTEEEAIELANDTTYGLAGAVWTADAGRAQRVAGRLRHGTVWINDYNTYLPQAEWGGFKQSGIGRELGPSGLDEYREAKHIWQNTSPAPTGWFGG